MRWGGRARYLFSAPGRCRWPRRGGDDGPSKKSRRWKYRDDWVGGPSQEGPKILKCGRLLSCARGSVPCPPTGHMIVAARSKTIDGPWENSPYNPSCPHRMTSDGGRKAMAATSRPRRQVVDVYHPTRTATTRWAASAARADRGTADGWTGWPARAPTRLRARGRRRSARRGVLTNSRRPDGRAVELLCG